MDTITLLVADDAPTRLGIRMALDGEVQLCAEVDDGCQAIRAAKRDQPDVCLIGRSLCGDGMSTVRGVCRAAPDVAVVILAQEGNDEDLLDAVRAGAIGYVPGALDAARLRRVIYALAAGEAVVPRAMVLDLVMELRGGGDGADALTHRESQVLGMLRRGHSTAAIAGRLGIAPVTVRRHISELVHKFGVEDRSELLSGGGWAQARRQQRTAATGLNGPSPVRLSA
jgi:DNA-binding NarL/FixJ family response regulator